MQQHPKDALALASPEGLDGHHCINWARPECVYDGTDPPFVPNLEPLHADLDMRGENFQANLSNWVKALPPAPVSIPWDVEDDACIERLLAALFRDGSVILLNAVPPEVCDQVVEDVGPYMDAQFKRQGGPRRSKSEVGTSVTMRVGALPARSEASWPMLMHPAVMKICDAVIGKQVLHMDKDELQHRTVQNTSKVPWQMMLSRIIQVLPRCDPQLLHRDGTYIELDLKNSLEFQISTLWALCDFTEELGATRVVPGSHRWPSYRRATEEEIQVLSAPREIARQFPTQLQRLLGYDVLNDTFASEEGEEAA
jgi:hypothetical protein